ncbi:hypothetical protein IQ05_00971 [Flavobacterium tiangeerense]|uniref:Uncharacterized protein n=1 Tax=Flavobacterium tiangeerense TaxID=459471 RepID=A0ABY3FLQ9_9FLAO|nr:hypothetical protein IQ05_00971 [Flavobacterium tiangeerense]
MRKITTLLCLFYCCIAFSQEKEVSTFKKNEIKGNAVLLIAGIVEITYERLITEDSGVGISFFLWKKRRC